MSVSAQNDGNAAGEVAAVLSVDGVGIDAATLSVGPGESVSKRFEVDFSVAGSYTVAIETDRTVAERFISVSYPTPDPSADSCSVLPSSVTTGEPFTVTASISNSGAGGEVVARLSDQNGEIESTTLSVESGGSQPVDFEVIYDEPNLNGYDISFDALSPPFVGVEITEARIR